MIELAVTIDAGEPSVKACYTLEGDGPLALSCYEVFSTVRASLQVKHWANTRALARKFAAERQLPALKRQLMTYVLTCVQTGFTYFESRFGGELLPCVKGFKAASLFHRLKITDLHPDASTVDDFKAFPFLHDAIPDLQKELPQYLAAAEGVSAETELVKKSCHTGQLHVSRYCYASHPLLQLRGCLVPSKTPSVTSRVEH